MGTFNSEEFTKKTAESALNNILFNGKSIREWIEIIDSEDCISRKDVLNCFPLEMQGELFTVEQIRHQLKKLPPVINIRIKEN